MQAFRSAIFHCIEKAGAVYPEYYDDGLLLVSQGKVVKAGRFDQLKDQLPKDLPVKHFKNSLIAPGFVDVHLHYPQYKIIGSYGKKLLDWLNIYTFVEEQKFSDKAYAERIAKLFFNELVRNGTTTAMSFCTSHPNSVDAYFEEAQRRNLRMIGGKVMMDRNAPEALCDNPELGYEDSKKLLEKWHGKDRLSYAVTPRFAPTSTAQQLQKSAQLLNEYKATGVRCQTHMNENIDEIAWVKELYPERSSYFDVYDHYGLSGAQSVFGHCIHNTPAELQRMGDSGSKIALCPTSNLFLGSGLFNLDTLESYHIDCALASDVGGGTDFSMLQTMHEAYKISKLNNVDLPPVKAYYLSTLAGAKVIGLEDKIGNFEPDKEADFIVFDLAATELVREKMAMTQTIDEILFSLMVLGDDRAIQSVYIMGELATMEAV